MSDEEQVPPEPASDPTPAPTGAGGRRVRLVVGVLTLAFVASLVGVVLLWRDRQSDQALVDAGVEAEEAARAAVIEMTSYDHTTVEEDFSWVEDAGTTQFQEYFEGASTNAVALIKELRASATGTVVDSAADIEDPSHVQVLLFVDQEIKSQGQRGAKLDQPRVTMDMVLEDDRWLVDKVAVNNLLTQ